MFNLTFFWVSSNLGTGGVILLVDWVLEQAFRYLYQISALNSAKFLFFELKKSWAETLQEILPPKGGSECLK
jgi:hypothetical protein